MKISKLTTADLDKMGASRDDGIRQLRTPLLEKAYDAYKVAVVYGEVEETPEEHKRVMKWAQRLRDKDATALDEVPEKVKYYL